MIITTTLEELEVWFWYGPEGLKIYRESNMKERIKEILEEAEDIYRTPGYPDAVYDAYIYLQNTLEHLLEIEGK